MDWIINEATLKADRWKLTECVISSNWLKCVEVMGVSVLAAILNAAIGEATRPGGV